MNGLWHFTCAHRAPLIGERGVLRPNPQPFLNGRALVWLTDLERPDRDGLGLTNTLLECDRTEFRYRVLSHVGTKPWMTSPWRMHMTEDRRDDMERYGQPLRWYVSDQPVPVALARYRETRQR